MKRKRFTEEQIVAILKEAAGSDNAHLVVRKHGITATTFYRWKAKYSGMGLLAVKRLKALEEENIRLKRLVADLSLDHAMLKDVLDESGDARAATDGRHPSRPGAASRRHAAESRLGHGLHQRSVRDRSPLSRAQPARHVHAGMPSP